jgi:hypothetical protein
MESNTIDYYVITMREPERLKNIENQMKKSDISINYIDAVVGKNLDIDKYIEKNYYLQIFMRTRVKNSQINLKTEKMK